MVNMMRARRLLLAAAVALLMTVQWPASVAARTFCVNPGGTSGCYAAIQDAINAADWWDTINVAAGTYHETNILVDKGLTINGAGPKATIVDGGGAGEVFRFQPGLATLTGMQLRHAERGVNTNVDGCGGTITLVDMLITENSTGTGAGVWAPCVTLTIIGSTIANNNATGTPGVFGCDWGGGSGGGIAMLCSGTVLNLINSTVSGNTATFVGGGIVANDTDLTMVNSTISGNSSAHEIGGGGLFVGGAFPRVTINSSTFANNSAVQGAGIASGFDPGTGAHLALRESIMDNRDGADCAQFTPFTSEGYNVGRDASCGFTSAGDVENRSARLLPLANNGGPTKTHALRGNSPALDRVPAALCAPPTHDQRGVGRPQGARCDSGSYEKQRGDGDDHGHDQDGGHDRDRHQ